MNKNRKTKQKKAVGFVVRGVDWIRIYDPNANWEDETEDGYEDYSS